MSGVGGGWISITKGIIVALSQIQIIQSLGEALSWFQRELEWGVQPAELKHLTGRIGELYAALITNGRMAEQSQQAGYDVTSKNNERISVKTTTMMEGSGHVSFNVNTLAHVDRVMILRINMNDDEDNQDIQIEILLDAKIDDAIALMSGEQLGRRTISLSRLRRPTSPIRPIQTATEVSFEGISIRELETGTIQVARDGVELSPVKPILRELAQRLNVGLLNSQGNTYTTRQLGALVIKSIQELQSTN